MIFLHFIFHNKHNINENLLTFFVVIAFATAVKNVLLALDFQNQLIFNRMHIFQKSAVELKVFTMKGFIPPPLIKIESPYNQQHLQVSRSSDFFPALNLVRTCAQVLLILLGDSDESSISVEIYKRGWRYRMHLLLAAAWSTYIQADTVLQLDVAASCPEPPRNVLCNSRLSAYSHLNKLGSCNLSSQKTESPAASSNLTNHH